MKEIDTLRNALLNARTRFLHLAMQNAEWKNCAESHVREIDAALEQAGVKRFDEKAFDEAVSRPNGWDAVPDPVAEIRRMRGDIPDTEPLPLPWSTEKTQYTGSCFDWPIRDANGSTVAMFVREADAEKIVYAVNTHADLCGSVSFLHSNLSRTRRDLDALEQACEEVLDADTLKAVQEAKKRIKDLAARRESTI